MKRKNFFILLELPFDPATNDIAQIKSAIHAKSSEWSRLQRLPEQKSVALENIELVPLMEEVMLDEEKRRIEAKEAGKIRGGMASSFEAELRVLETKGYIIPREIKKLHQKYRPYGFDYDLIRRLVRVPVTDIAPKITNEKVKIKALELTKGMLINEHLTLLNQKTLYGFLNRTASNGAKDLFNVASAIKHHTFNSVQKSGQTTATLLLADLALEVFETEETKKAYDLFLNINTYPELSGLINDEYLRVGFISPEVLMRLVNFGITTYGANVLELEEYVRSYCKAYDIDINIASPHVVCPVCEHHSPRGSTFCTECYSPLEGNCPLCNTFFTDGAKVCSSCGFVVGKMGFALPYIERAKTAILSNNWVDASNNIEGIEKFWPNHKEIDSLKTQLANIKEKYNNTVDCIEIAAKEHKFYQAVKLIDEAQKHNNLVIPTKLVASIKTTLSNFESQLLVLTNRETVGYDSLTLLASQVSDSLELNQLLAKFPPEAPARLTVSTTIKSVNLSWDRSPSSGLINYVLVRKKGGIPLTAYDGDILYEGEKNHFEDTTLNPLEKYFYSVFSKRSGSYSNMGAVTVSLVRVIPTLENFSATPADSAAQLSWVTTDQIYQIKIWRKSGGEAPTSNSEGELLNNTRIDSYTDTNLTNDHNYWYYGVALYKTEDGEILESVGVVTEVIPHKSVIPVDQFLIIPTDEDDRYFINWEGASSGDIIFFTSTTSPSYPFGKMVPIEELLKKYNRIELDAQISNNARFNLDFTGDIYIFPVVVSGKFGAMGKVEYITNVPNVQHIDHEIVGKDLYIKFDWPVDDKMTVIVAWREDIYPKGITQKDTLTVSITREEYDVNSYVKIPDIASNSYYFRLFTVFVSADHKTIYSDGANLLVDNTPSKEFFYDVQYKKSPFSSTANVSVSIKSDHIFNLPHALLVGKVGSVPLNLTDGDAMFEIERQQDIAGAITYRYKSEPLPPNLYVRMFFFEDQYYNKFRPIPNQLLVIK